MQFVKTIYGGVCGPHNTRLIYYRNIHPSNPIRITVEVTWTYEGHDYRDEKKPVLLPSKNPYAESPGPEDYEAGCPIPGPTMQQFHYKVVNAEWA
jgi:hypothetical protein